MKVVLGVVDAVNIVVVFVTAVFEIGTAAVVAKEVNLVVTVATLVEVDTAYLD